MLCFPLAPLASLIASPMSDATLILHLRALEYTLFTSILQSDLGLRINPAQLLHLPTDPRKGYLNTLQQIDHELYVRGSLLEPIVNQLCSIG